jgi:choline monooxygenase
MRGPVETQTKIGSTLTLPWSWYSDPAVLEAERERIFKCAWQYVGHMGELQGPGSYFASHVAGVPVVITLDRDGELHGFVNVCRHRGAIVAHGAHKRGTLQCPYHAWTYDLDGTLRAAPRSERDPSFRCSELGLRTISVGTWGPFVLGNLDAQAEPLADVLDDLPQVVAEHGLDISELRFRDRFHYEIKANWKIAVENYLECYHCAINHPGLVQVIDDRALALQPSGWRASMWAPADRRALDGTGPLDAHGPLAEGQNHLVFPALKFNVLPGHPNLSIGPLWPVATDRCAGFLDYFFGPSASEEWIADLYTVDEAVGNEDTRLVQDAQLGTSSGMIEHGRLLGGSETLIAHFQQFVRSRLADWPGVGG